MRRLLLTSLLVIPLSCDAILGVDDHELANDAGALATTALGGSSRIITGGAPQQNGGTGGITAVGTTVATGGAVSTGGLPPATGGALNTGGSPATGGASNTGGSAGGSSGLSPIQQACNDSCAVITGPKLKCKLKSCPDQCAAIYSDPGVTSVLGCQDAYLSALQCGALQPMTDWTCDLGLALPTAATGCSSIISTLTTLVGCTHALAANRSQMP
jgi:hypothetical protein